MIDIKIINKLQMISLMDEYPDGGIVFADYEPCVLKSNLMVTDGDFGATNVIPHEGEVFDWDWNINEYKDSELFAIFDNNDVLQMIQVLVSGLKINLIDES